VSSLILILLPDKMWPRLAILLRLWCCNQSIGNVLSPTSYIRPFLFDLSHSRWGSGNVAHCYTLLSVTLLRYHTKAVIIAIVRLYTQLPFLVLANISVCILPSDGSMWNHYTTIKGRNQALGNGSALAVSDHPLLDQNDAWYVSSKVIHCYTGLLPKMLWRYHTTCGATFQL